ncbi:MAG TPA: dual specificity protein phosphatase family protein [Polyangiaceae bacterium]|nr:dual specificity protein phosphatase family protein [Polyangiaceae bacterium]
MCLSALVSSGLLASCEVAPARVSNPPMGDEASGDQAVMKGFSWVIDKQVAGMPRPGAKRPLDQDLLFLRDQGVDALVSLTEKPVDPEALGRHGIEALHIPVPDFQAPTQAQLDQYVNAVQGWVGASRQVGTHCAAGLGRTGTFLAALFVARGMDADAAIAEVRRLRPGSIETKEQEQAVREFFARKE